MCPGVFCFGVRSLRHPKEKPPVFQGGLIVRLCETLPFLFGSDDCRPDRTVCIPQGASSYRTSCGVGRLRAASSQDDDEMLCRLFRGPSRRAVVPTFLPCVRLLQIQDSSLEVVSVVRCLP
jgi:hypothetical protein